MKKIISEYCLPVDINPDNGELRHIMDFETMTVIKENIENKHREEQRKWIIR